MRDNASSPPIAKYQVTPQLQIFGRLLNLFDRQYETFGILGSNFFPNGAFDPVNAGPEQFRAVAPPRAFYVGIRYDFTKPPANRE